MRHNLPSKALLGIDDTLQVYLSEMVPVDSAYCDPAELASMAVLAFAEPPMMFPGLVDSFIATIAGRFHPGEREFVERAVRPFAEHMYREFYHMRNYASIAWVNGVFQYRFERMTDAKIVLVRKT